MKNISKNVEMLDLASERHVQHKHTNTKNTKKDENDHDGNQQKKGSSAVFHLVCFQNHTFATWLIEVN